MDPNELAKLKNLDLRTTIQMLKDFVLILNHAEELLQCAIQAAEETGITLPDGSEQSAGSPPSTSKSPDPTAN